MATLCPNCRTEAKADQKFCRRCGAPLPTINTALVSPSSVSEPLQARHAAGPIRDDRPAPRTPTESHDERRVSTQAQGLPRLSPARDDQRPPDLISTSVPGRGTALKKRLQDQRKWLVPLAASVVVVVLAGAAYFVGGDRISSAIPMMSGKPPARAEQHVGQGLSYVSLKDYDNAIKEFSRAIDVAPRYSVAYANRGIAYAQVKKLNLALDDLKKATELDPKDKLAHYNLATLYALRGEKDRALESLDLALQLGFDRYDALRTDPDLTTIRSDPEFSRILEKHKIFLR